jgi:hypothetical protein
MEAGRGFGFLRRSEKTAEPSFLTFSSLTIGHMAKRCRNCGTYFIDDEVHDCEAERASRGARSVGKRQKPEEIRRRVALLLVPAAVLLAIQFVGLANTDRGLHQIVPLGHHWLFVGTGVVLSLFAPLLSVAALFELRDHPAEGPTKTRLALVVVAVVLVATSWIGCGLTFLTHPVWTAGY